MNAASQKIVSEIDSLLEKSQTFKERYEKSPPHNTAEDLYEDFLYFHTRGVYILNLLGKRDFAATLDAFKSRHVRLDKNPIDTPFELIVKSRTVLKITKQELEQGLIFKISDLAKSEVFGNFLEYSRHLLDNGYKDAAAVMIGGVLEDMLRGECEKRGIDTKNEKGKNLTIDPLNIALKGACAYDLLKQKQITVWADIRNNAAHADYEKYTLSDVEDMYKYVLGLSF